MQHTPSFCSRTTMVQIPPDNGLAAGTPQAFAMGKKRGGKTGKGKQCENDSDDEREVCKPRRCAPQLLLTRVCFCSYRPSSTFSNSPMRLFRSKSVQPVRRRNAASTRRKRKERGPTAATTSSAARRCVTPSLHVVSPVRCLRLRRLTRFVAPRAAG